MFVSRDQRRGACGHVDVAFTDRHGGVSAAPYDTLDLSRARLMAGSAEVAQNYRLVARELGVDDFTLMAMEHGARVVDVATAGEVEGVCDAMVTTQRDLALAVSVGDCVPVVLADADAGVVGVAHAGRPGVVAGVVPAAVERMRALGATSVTAWLGPRICGGCYEVPAAMRDDVSAVVPAAWSCTTWGTPSVDIGAGVRSQLATLGCEIVDVDTCTLESPDLFSYRRDGRDSGRFAGLVVLRADGDR